MISTQSKDMTGGLDYKTWVFYRIFHPIAAEYTLFSAAK
jgi:hypothetical protein